MKLFKRYKVVISGTSPLRQQRRPLPGDHKIPKLGSDIPTEDVQKKLFENARMWEKKGGYYQTANQIMKAITLISHREKVPGQGNLRFSRLIGEGGIMIEPEKIFHKNQKDVIKIGHWTVNEQRGKRNQIWTVKCQIDKWELEFIITNNLPEVLTKDYLYSFVEMAGMFCGVGQDRPGRGKTFGRYEIKKFDEI